MALKYIKKSDVMIGSVRSCWEPILLVVLILLLVGALPAWPYSRNWGYYPGGGLGLLLLILVILLLMGRICRPKASGGSNFWTEWKGEPPCKPACRARTEPRPSDAFIERAVIRPSTARSPEKPARSARVVADRDLRLSESAMPGRPRRRAGCRCRTQWRPIAPDSPGSSRSTFRTADRTGPKDDCIPRASDPSRSGHSG